MLLLVAILFATPKPPASTTYLDLTLQFSKGKLAVTAVARGRYPAPTTVKRYAGRFDARVFSHGKQIDDYRFDLPLLADADPGNEPALADKLRANLTTTARVRVPLPDGADAVAIHDSHGGPPLTVPLPPEPPATSSPDAGSPPPADTPPPR